MATTWSSRSRTGSLREPMRVRNEGAGVYDVNIPPFRVNTAKSAGRYHPDDTTVGDHGRDSVRRTEE